MTLSARPARAPGNIERQVADHTRALDEFSREPMFTGRVITVNLANAVRTSVRHGLGRQFTAYYLSAPKGAAAAGYIVEAADGNDSEEVVLTANGYGATITLRMYVW